MRLLAHLLMKLFVLIVQSSVSSLFEMTIPKFYQARLQKQLTRGQFLLLTMLLDVIQSEKQMRLERLIRVFRIRSINRGNSKKRRFTI